MHPPITSRRRFLLAACAMGAAAAAPAHARDWHFPWSRDERVRGSGKLRHEERPLGRISGLALSLPGTVEVRTGAADGIVIDTDDNLLALIETVVEDGTLKIRPRRGSQLEPTQLKIVVSTRGLDRLALAGSGNILADALRGNRVRLDVGGSGAVVVDRIEADTVSVNLGGSGTLKAGGGSAHNVALTIGGSGDIDLGRLQTDGASATIAGSGDATLWVRDNLSVTVAGSGDIAYYGDPQISKSVVGSGGLKRLGPAPR